MTESIQFELNGSPTRILTDPGNLLLWVLRNEIELTGTKFGCGLGFCGSCTVMLDDEPVRSCMIPVSDAAGKRVLTIEGLARNGALHPIQQAFVDNDAVQCGYCTSGMIMNAYGFLLKNPEPSKKEIVEGMEENLCRCSTYNRVIQAIQEAAREMKGGQRI